MALLEISPTSRDPNSSTACCSSSANCFALLNEEYVGFQRCCSRRQSSSAATHDKNIATLLSHLF